jgi:hypothetical protein
VIDETGVGATLDEKDASIDLVAERVPVPVEVDVRETVVGGVFDGDADIATDEDIDGGGREEGESVIELVIEGAIVSDGVLDTSVSVAEGKPNRVNVAVGDIVEPELRVRV